MRDGDYVPSRYQRDRTYRLRAVIRTMEVQERTNRQRSGEKIGTDHGDPVKIQPSVTCCRKLRSSRHFEVIQGRSLKLRLRKSRRQTRKLRRPNRHVGRRGVVGTVDALLLRHDFDAYSLSKPTTIPGLFNDDYAIGDGILTLHCPVTVTQHTGY